MQTKLHKALAVLLTLAMLCTLLPLSVAAADVEMLVNGNFETGNANGWTLDSGSSVTSSDKHGGSYAIKTTATSTKYQSMFYQLFDVMPNTDYTLTYWYKYDGTGSGPAIYVLFKDAGRDVTLNDSNSRRDGLTSGSWVKDTFTFNTGDNEQVTINFANRVAGLGGTFYFDDISVIGPEIVIPDEPVNPVPEVDGNLVENGNFETGNTSGWEKHQSTAVSADAAYTGYYGIKLGGNGGWGGMLNQSVAVEAGQSYKVSMWVKTISNGVNIQIKDGGENGAKLGSDWFTATEWTYKTWTVSPTTNSLFLNFCGGGNGVAETVYVDDIVITKAPLIENGDFETGDKTGWSCNSGTSTIVTDAHGGNYALQLSNPSKWGEAAVRTIGVKPNTQYEVSWWSKRVDGTGAFNLIVCQAVSPWANFERLSGENWMNKSADMGWVQNTCVYNSGDNTQMLLKFTSEAASAGTILLDDITVTELKDPSFDGYLYNGDFETGKTSGWNMLQQSAVTEDSACNGRYGLHLQGNGGWGTMADQYFTTVPGQHYTLFAYLKTVKTGANVHVRDKATDAKLASTWFSKTGWSLVQLSFIATSENSFVAFCGGGNGNAESVYVDDVFIVPTKPMTNDGYIYNGNFESGSLIGWTTHQQSVLSNKAAYEGTAGIIMKGTGWGGTANQTFKVDMGNTYKLSFRYKPISGGINVQVLNAADDSKITSRYISTSDGSDWILFEQTFNVGYCEKVTLNFCGSGSSSTDEMYVDNISIVNVDGEENVRSEVMENTGISVRDAADDIRGLAFRFELNASGVQVFGGNQYKANTGLVSLYKNRLVMGNLVRAGAVVTNDATIGQSFADFTLNNVDGAKTIDVPAQYLIDLEDNSMGYAVRVINIPDAHTATEIYARPYYIYNLDGEEVVVYGVMTHANYDGITGDHKAVNILTIGNSFSVDAMKNHLYDVFKSADYDQVILGNLYIGGCSLDTHWNNINGGLTAYQYQKNDDNGEWVYTENVAPLTALQDETWDIITIQQASPDSGKSNTYGNLQNIVNWVNANKTNSSAKVMWHMTWAYQQDSTHDGFPYYNSDQMTMYNAIVDTVQNHVLTVDGINGVIPSGTAIQNLRTSTLGDTLTADGYHLKDTYGDYTAALTWYRALTGESLDLVTYWPDSVVDYKADIMQAAARAVYTPYAVSDLSETIILGLSDFQASTDEKGATQVQNILNGAIAQKYGLFDGLFAVGDYSAQMGYDVALTGIQALDQAIDPYVSGNKIYTEGNHDAPDLPGLSPTGNNDPAGGKYGVLVINEEDYDQFGDGGEACAALMQSYFDEKLADSTWGNKPIFVLCHVPLHYSMRTETSNNAKTARPMVDVLNEAGAAGLNVLFLFGHNHSGGYDDFLGGGSVYLKKGDTMMVPEYGENFKYNWETVTLNFTYMNVGYVGYCADHGVGADVDLTVTTYRIQSNGEVIITRWDKNGEHNLKSKGVKNTVIQDTFEPDETVYESSRVVTATDDRKCEE